MDGGSQDADNQGEPLPLALRAWAVPEVTLDPRRPGQPPRHPRWLLVFDTETRLDPAQAMTIGFARVYRPRRQPFADSPAGFECYGEYLIVGESLTASELETLDQWVAAHPMGQYTAPFWDSQASTFRKQQVPVWLTPDGVPLVVISRRDFVRFVLFRMLRTARALIVGFNLPFDLSRLAVGWGATRRTRRRREEDGTFRERKKPWDGFTGGFSLQYDEPGDSWLPRIAIKTIDSKRHLIALRGAEDGDRVPADQNEEHRQRGVFHGHFLDLRTLAFAMTNEGMSLKRAGEVFGTAHASSTITRQAPSQPRSWNTPAPTSS